MATTDLDYLGLLEVGQQICAGDGFQHVTDWHKRHPGIQSEEQFA